MNLGLGYGVFIAPKNKGPVIQSDCLWNNAPRYCLSHMDKGENIETGFGEQNPRWSVFYGVKVILATPEALMAEIDTAISKLEYAPATARLESPSSSSVSKNKSSDSSPRPQYDAQLAGEAYRAGCAALAAGKLDEALYSLNISLLKFPPDKTNAVAKLQSLSAPASQQLHKSPI